MNTSIKSHASEPAVDETGAATTANTDMQTAKRLGGLPLYLWIVVGGVIATLLAALLLWWLRAPELHGVLIQSPDSAPDFTLMSTTGEPMSLSDFEGKHVMLYFGYTFCPDVCPAALTDLRMMLDELGPKRAEDVQVIMISVDPERDDIDTLKTYVEFFHPSFIGMTGEPEEIQDIASQFGIYFEKHNAETAAGYLVNHTAVTTYVDDNGYIRMVFPDATTGVDMAADMVYLMRR